MDGCELCIHVDPAPDPALQRGLRDTTACSSKHDRSNPVGAANNCSIDVVSLRVKIYIALTAMTLTKLKPARVALG